MFSSCACITVLMEAISDELRTYSKGKSLIKFTTVYPAMVCTGFAKKLRVRYVYRVRYKFDEL